MTIGDHTFVGAGAVILNGLSVGRRVTVGAGAVVIRDVPDDVTVVGNPARPIRDVPEDALGVARGKQEVREGWAARFRKKAKKPAPEKEDAESSAQS